MGLAAQMNIRIDADLKAAGDAALAEVGLNPSQAVRRLWELAASLRGRAADLAAILAPTHAVAQDEERACRIAAAERGPQICADFLHGLGIDPTEPWENAPSDEELREEAWLERMRERGML